MGNVAGIMIYEIKGLPMPPTINGRLMPSRGRLIKSPEIRQFDQMIMIYGARAQKHLKEISEALKSEIQTGKVLQIEFEFYFPREKLIGKAGQPKQRDVDSRIKSSLDAVAKLIDIDDKYVFHLHAYKVPANVNEEFVNVKIKAFEQT